ncbi:MAG: glycoside hydrolase family 3 C-terminal domain-containing protein [Phycisphaerae bacterium]|nr:glycoside hydrolase family 3 C-terminal domain-containing protein [Phycisphaerae bacterium]
MIFCVCLVLVCLSLSSCVVREVKTGGGLAAQDNQVAVLLARMTLDEKIGQMIQPDNEFLKDPADVAKYHLGSVLSGGSSDPKAGNSVENWADMYDMYQTQALSTRLGIPLLYGVDAVHGHSNVINAVIFPHNIGLGCTRNPALMQQIGKITALEMRATGVQWTFAPCVTIPRDERWGRTYEGLGEDPMWVGRLGAASVHGLQLDDLSNPLAVAACAKHFIGDGGTTAVTTEADGQNAVRTRLDQGNTEIDEAGLRAIHLPPYRAAIDAGVATIMPSYSSWNGVKCSASKRLLTEILKDEMGFEGFLISDYRAIDQVHPDYKTAIGICINAGMDMGMIPSKYKEFHANLKALVEEGVVPMSRIDDAVTRILRVKFAMGLMDQDRSQLTDRSLWPQVGSAAHREVGRQAVRESLVLLKNDRKTLPLSKKAARIHVAGIGANDIGMQCGGWTIDWQGKMGEVTTGGTTILQAIQQTVSGDTEVTYSQDGSNAAGADVGVVVMGERPYAEGNGDSAALAITAEDLQLVKTLKQAGMPVVVILLSGRPLIINDVLAQADAFVAAWLPGTEGQGVADVLFGDYKFKGKLSVTWPRSVDQLPINVGDTDYDPLFAYGFGMKQ